MVHCKQKHYITKHIESFDQISNTKIQHINLKANISKDKELPSVTYQNEKDTGNLELAFA